MSITLKPEQKQIIQSQVQSRRFATADQAIDRALRILEEWDASDARWVAETRQKLASASASAQIDRGEVLDGPTVIAQLQAKLNQTRAVAECRDS